MTEEDRKDFIKRAEEYRKKYPDADQLLQVGLPTESSYKILKESKGRRIYFDLIPNTLDGVKVRYA